MSEVDDIQIKYTAKALSTYKGKILMQRMTEEVIKVDQFKVELKDLIDELIREDIGKHDRYANNLGVNLDVMDTVLSNSSVLLTRNQLDKIISENKKLKEERDGFRRVLHNMNKKSNKGYCYIL